jgi:hypothetical protein
MIGWPRLLHSGGSPCPRRVGTFTATWLAPIGNGSSSTSWNRVGGTAKMMRRLDKPPPPAKRIAPWHDGCNSVGFGVRGRARTHASATAATGSMGVLCRSSFRHQGGAHALHCNLHLVSAKLHLPRGHSLWGTATNPTALPTVSTVRCIAPNNAAALNDPAVPHWCFVARVRCRHSVLWLFAI